MQHVFKVLTILVLLLASANAATAEIYWELVGHDPCIPPQSGGPTHKDTYAGYDSQQGGNLVGWYIYNYDGSESWVPNQGRVRDRPSDDGASGSRLSAPPVKPEVLRYFTRNLANLQRLAGGDEITVSITSEIAPELGDVGRMTIKVPAGMLSPRGGSPILKARMRPVDLR